ncbi:hypothetical protein CYMTET_21073 [Cymbomonas tetramitiformis]|uniref:Uncharacterized protein n=1 Tax=Cymbomonas tetramitiformis TaxID=36881 RepID=A0AAE0G2T6_9CHLO|nr:hypothetical protein CYMTET_21073 [Cymbomonas tetramitiformis]
MRAKPCQPVLRLAFAHEHLRSRQLARQWRHGAHRSIVYLGGERAHVAARGCGGTLGGGARQVRASEMLAAGGCGGTESAMERDETRRHLQAAEARGALLGRALGGGA